MTEFFVGDKVRIELPRGYSKRGVLGISVLYTTWPEARFEGATGRITQINPVGPYSVPQYLVDFREFDNSRLGIPWQAQWFREEWMTLLERGTLAAPPPTQPGPRTSAEDSASPIHGGTSPGGDDRTPAQAGQERNRLATGGSAGERPADPPRTEAVGSGVAIAPEPPAAAEPLVAPVRDVEPGRPLTPPPTPEYPLTATAEPAGSAVDANNEVFPDVPPTAAAEPAMVEPFQSAEIGGDRVGRGAGLLGEAPDEVEMVEVAVEPTVDARETAPTSDDAMTVVTETEMLIVEDAAPETRPPLVTSGPGWVRVRGSAVCPDGFPIKGNAKSKIFHRPSDDSYGQTVPEICFESDEAAIAAGFRPRAAGRPGMGGRKDIRKPRR